MSCNRNSSGWFARAGAAMVLASALAACAKQSPGVVAAPSPAPPPVEAAAPLPPPIYRVRSGTQGALAKYPRGTKVSFDEKICLNDGDQITIAGNNGQSVTFKGPGCMVRTGDAEFENDGGFILGQLRAPDSNTQRRAR